MPRKDDGPHERQSTPRLTYTLGTSNRTADEFVELLRHFEILTVVDVRRFPKSRVPHFVQDTFRQFLHAAGIAYFHLGDTLGGYRGPDYETYMTSSDFSLGLRRLMDQCERAPTAIVCAERLPWRCHRRFIGSALRAEGWEVAHILDKDKVWQPSGEPHRDPQMRLFD